MSAEGLYERFQGRLAPEAIEHYYGPGLEKARWTVTTLIDVLRAHVVMLSEESIIEGPVARQLLTGLSDLRSVPPQELALDPRREDLYVNLEHLLEERLGDVAGYLATARSRNDIEAAMGRIRLRKELNQVTAELHALIRVLIDQSDRYAETIMPGYTHAQPAQPISLGFYFMAVAQPLLRHCSRLAGCYTLLDENPLGAAALSGTGFPVNQARTGELLGFVRTMENALDAVAANDHTVEAALVASQIAATLGRLGEDLVRWSAFEAGFIHFADGFCDSSSIMPQKRNPVMAETLRSQGRQSILEAAGVVTAGSAAYEAGRDISVAEGRLWELLHTVTGMCRVAAGMVSTLHVYPERMAKVVRESACTVTELVDTLVRQCDIPFRLSHRVVGSAVAKLQDQGEAELLPGLALLDESAVAVLGRTTGLTQEQLEDALNPMTHLIKRAGTGGPDPATVRSSGTRASDRLNGSAAQLAARSSRLEHSQALLSQACETILSGPSE